MGTLCVCSPSKLPISILNTEKNKNKPQILFTKETLWDYQGIFPAMATEKPDSNVHSAFKNLQKIQVIFNLPAVTEISVVKSRNEIHQGIIFHAV